MKYLTIIILLTMSGYSFGQTVSDPGFRLAIILPDTMIMDSKLREYARAVESDHVKDYYRILQEMENQLETWKSRDSLNRFPIYKRTMEKRLDSAKTLEPEVKRYKYFYKIADYSLYYFKLKCGESSSKSDFLVIGTKTPSKKTIKEITEKFNLDYLVKYTQISARSKDKEYEMAFNRDFVFKKAKSLVQRRIYNA